MNLRGIVLLICMLIVSNNVSASLNYQVNDSTKNGIHKFLLKITEENSFQGAVLVAQYGNIIYQEAFGYSDLESKTPNKIETKFLIGSTTKSFTAVAIIQLMENGLVNLHTPIDKYLPDLKPELSEKLTLHLLLKMQSGLPDHLERLTNLEYEDVSNERIIEIINEADLEFKPGTAYKYSNINYTLTAIILERITGKYFSEYLNEKIFIPLEMRNSGIERTHDIIPEKARGYELSKEMELQPANRNYMAYALGSGDIYSSIEDLYKWDKGLENTALISDKSKELMFRENHQEELGPYGYGFRIHDYVRAESNFEKGKLIRHGGSMQGYLANFHKYLDDELTVIVLSNVRPLPIMDITFGIKELVLGRKPTLRSESTYKY